jgi:hypothetical protein
MVTRNRIHKELKIDVDAKTDAWIEARSVHVHMIYSEVRDGILSGAQASKRS